MQGVVWFHTVGACPTCGKHIQQNLGRHVTLYHDKINTAVAMPGDLVYGLERHIAELRRSHEESL